LFADVGGSENKSPFITTPASQLPLFFSTRSHSHAAVSRQCGYHSRNNKHSNLVRVMERDVNLLIVDDSYPSRRALAAAMRLGGITAEIQEADNGIDAIAVLLTQQIDCAFVDFRMPGKDGLEVLLEARAAGITTPIIITTGAGDEQTAVAMMKAGATDYLAKSHLTAEQVQQSLRNALRVGESDRRARAADAQLRESEQFHRAVLNSLTAQIAVLDRDGKIISVNQAWRDFGMQGGATSHSLSVGQNYIDVCDQAVAQGDLSAIECQQGLAQVFSGQRDTFTMEYPCHSPDKRRWFLMHAAPLPKKNGGAVVSHIDITERYVVDEARRQSEARFRRIFEANIIGVVFWDAQGCITDANDALLSLIGYSRAEMTRGRLNVWELTPTEEHELCRAGFAEIAATGVCHPFEKHYIRKDGTPIPVYVVAAALDGGAEAGIELVVDLTAQKQIEEERRQTLEMLESLIRTTPAAIQVRDRQGRVLIWNRGAERIFGWTAAEVIGKTPPYLTPEAMESFNHYCRRVFSGETIENVELQRVRKDGSMRTLTLTASPLHDRNGNIAGLTAIFADITEARQLQRQLLQSQRMESVGRLAGGVAHDFNNILAIISGYSEGLIRRLNGDDALAEHVRQIEQAAERGAALTQQLLTFSRGQAVKLQPLDLNEVITNVFQMLRRLITSEITIEHRPGKDLGLIRADPGQIEQVLVNLTLNARDAMHGRGRIVIETTNITPADTTPPSPQANRPCVRLSVTDDGHGMDEQARARIFEPFFTTKERTGTGLGLWIVYGIVEHCGGAISVESQAGQGTTFNLFFPVNQQDR
jgi:PAS domain S-box-containing protein